ncbi:hypothetical protein F383_33812 [Gossypium arboreum]|nr:hypothetical protein F383_35674 [Gossypium arboreum]KHG15608.1 hypothetical protein F383_00245 [Gossypium arboreum]KHG27074.1 hypothetical protein F383_33812 [Gossypium arboreum]
MSGTLAS